MYVISYWEGRLTNNLTSEEHRLARTLRGLPLLNMFLRPAWSITPMILILLVGTLTISWGKYFVASLLFFFDMRLFYSKKSSWFSRPIKTTCTYMYHISFAFSDLARARSACPIPPFAAQNQ